MKGCVYINLATAEGRALAVEASFGAAAPNGWTLRRFEALGPGDVAVATGKLSPGASQIQPDAASVFDGP